MPVIAHASRRSVLVLAGALALIGPAAAQTPTTGTDAAIEALAERLAHDYVIPATGAKYAAMLRANLAARAYGGLADADLARRLTADLQAVAPDLHLRVETEARLAGGAGGPRPGGAAAPGGPQPRPRPPAITEQKWLADGVAYIDFDGFPGDPDTVAQVDAFMQAHAAAKAIIIDGRHHHGGGLAEMNVMLPYLYGTKTTLVAMDVAQSVVSARGDPPDNGTVETPGPKGVHRRLHIVTPNAKEKRLYTAKVFYLTSKRTGSAGEHLALAFKRTHRATLVGETTAGANHFGGFQPIGAGLAFFLPVGRTTDPETGWDWEGVGVAPDVPTPADQALETALKLAKG